MHSSNKLLKQIFVLRQNLYKAIAEIPYKCKFNLCCTYLCINMIITHNINTVRYLHLLFTLNGICQ